jgi:hypothetical protein
VSTIERRRLLATLTHHALGCVGSDVRRESFDALYAPSKRKVRCYSHAGWSYVKSACSLGVVCLQGIVGDKELTRKEDGGQARVLKKFPPKLISWNHHERPSTTLTRKRRCYTVLAFRSRATIRSD